ncbi:unnamed protein product [Dimorphilus gyrociliatus]|uniref:SLC41A/MgtE integral membrane domain-containing protein n=1 Tax=Dimorphilus gyrociliatus TaxID=2664684 RepID=A0A7I8VJF2_9ANNE|nr:unnamed protein product [Dimorphilus gyrociliatus]
MPEGEEIEVLLKENDGEEETTPTPIVSKPSEEGSHQMALQVFPSFIIAGIGLVAAGLVLDKVQHWEVYTKLHQITVLVTPLLGLKGNLEMTLASRLSTFANRPNKKHSNLTAAWGNICLVQLQATVVGILAAIVAAVFGWIPKGQFNFQNSVVAASASVATAMSASLILSVVMVLVVTGARKCKLNPDNIATPLAAALGDVTTLTLLSAIASLIYLSHFKWLPYLILSIALCLSPFWYIMSAKNELVKDALSDGWTPIISAMVISSAGGLVLDFALSSFEGLAVFQPVVNGAGGNIAAIHASRLSTALHTDKPINIKKSAFVLLGIMIPGHLAFLGIITYCEAGHVAITPALIISYFCAALLQVIILLFIAPVIVKAAWNRKLDPDSVAIPYLTAIGDLLGSMFLLTAFYLLHKMNSLN